MKHLKSVFSRVLLALVLITMVSIRVPVYADSYTYTVRIFAGNQGTINGDSVYVISGLKYGERTDFDPNMVQLKDGSRYYVRGIRESGKDNNETLSNLSFNVTGDMDYVVAYGIRGELVAYTVNYMDSYGNILSNGRTYYGNVGDKPVVAFLYLEGYQPNAYNLTKTLSANAAENVFTFVYTKLSTTTTTINTTTGNTTGTTNTTTGTATGTNAAAGTENVAGNGAEAGSTASGTNGNGLLNNAENGAAGNGTLNGTTTSGSENAPQELINLDEQVVPLANGTNLVNSRKIPPVLIIGGLVGALVLLALIAALILSRRRKNDDEKELYSEVEPEIEETSYDL